MSKKPPKNSPIRYRMKDVREELLEMGFAWSKEKFSKIYNLHFIAKTRNDHFVFTREEVEDLKRFFWVYRYKDTKPYPEEELDI